MLRGVYDIICGGRGRGGGGGYGCIAIAINLMIVLAEIVNFAPNNYFHTFAPLTKSWLRPWLVQYIVLEILNSAPI